MDKTNIGLPPAIKRMLLRGKSYHIKTIKEAMQPMQDAYITTPEWGERLKISPLADQNDLADNIRVARAILGTNAKAEVKIRPHSYDKGIKNPELEIDGLIADNKKVKGWKGITTGISDALNKQECSAVVIDLDAELKSLNLNEVAGRIAWRASDFNDGRLKACYVVFGGRSICIKHALLKSEIKQILKQLSPNPRKG